MPGSRGPTSTGVSVVSINSPRVRSLHNRAGSPHLSSFAGIVQTEAARVEEVLLRVPGQHAPALPGEPEDRFVLPAGERLFTPRGGVRQAARQLNRVQL